MDKAAQSAASVLQIIQGDQTPRGFLIRSSLAADESWAAVCNAKGHAKAKRRREYLTTAAQQDDRWRAALNAAAQDDVARLQEIIGDDSPTNDICWCDSAAEALATLTEVYRQLYSSSRPFDAYDYGMAGAVACIHVWRD